MIDVRFWHKAPGEGLFARCPPALWCGYRSPQPHSRCIRDSVNDGEERAHTDAQYRRERFSELVEAERKARGLSDDVVKAKRRTQLQKLVAPVAGTVQQLSVHTVGGVVTPAQAFSWSCRRTAASRLRPWC